VKRIFIVLVISIITFTLLTGCGTDTSPINTTLITSTTESFPLDNNKTSEVSSESNTILDEYAVIDAFINNYNTIADNQISDISKMDIQGEDYRTEFRLYAFKTAIGKKGVISNGCINIVNYGTNSKVSIRIYATADNQEDILDVYTTVIHTLDSSITDKEILNSYSSLEHVSYINIFLGESDYITGYINDCEIMIDCSRLNFVE